MMRRFIQALILAGMINTIHLLPVLACTLWAASGDAVESGGSLLIKNRDWAPNHRQELQVVVPKEGYKYVGLVALDGEYPGLKAGINEKGLVVVSASASSIPMKERKLEPSTHQLLHKLLVNSSTVDELLRKTELFLGPRFLMIADNSKVASIEIGLNGSVSIEVKENGAVYHTNHYSDEEMKQYNRITGISSLVRYQRIRSLLGSVQEPYDLDMFLKFSHDKNDGDDNSIFRVGSTLRKPRTLAVWAVKIPRDDTPELYVEVYNPGEPSSIKTYVLDKSFWDIESVSALLN